MTGPDLTTEDDSTGWGDYWQLEGMENVYLEDSYVMRLFVHDATVDFRMELVLTPDHPDYVRPTPSEDYCYADATIRFTEVDSFVTVDVTDSFYADDQGGIDFGNIHALRFSGDFFRIEGDWGLIEFRSRQGPVCDVIRRLRLDA